MSKKLLVLYLVCMGLSAPAGADYASAMAAYRSGDFTVAAKEFRRLAERGSVRAQSVLALMYEYGEGVARDPSEAARWYRRAAAGGHVGAQYILGGLYARGAGVTHDEAAALRWYRRAAQQGHARAQYELGRMLEEGRGAPQDLAAARRWYEAAAAQGHRQAAARLESSFQAPRLRANPAPPVSSRKPPDTPRDASPHAPRKNAVSRAVVTSPAFRVQLAAFRSRERASHAWSTLRSAHPDLLGELEPRIERSEPGGTSAGVWHRLQAGLLPSEAAAKRLCRDLERRGAASGCFPTPAGKH